MKKQYHKLALKWHPDKHSSHNDTPFKQIKEAYEYVLEHFDFQDDINANATATANATVNNTYAFLLTQFLQSLYADQTLTSFLESILLNKAPDAIRANITSVTESMLKDAYQLLYKYKDVFNINNQVLEFVSLCLKERAATNNNSNLVILKPTLQDMFNHLVYQLEYNDEKFLVPLWHNELCYDTKHGCELTVVCHPKLPENVCIDENNNLHCCLDVPFNYELLETDVVSLDLGGKSFAIPVSKLSCLKEQAFVLPSEGIARINESNMNDISCKSDVIITIRFVTRK